MAYDIEITDPYDARPNHTLRLYVRRDQTDNAGNRSSYAWQLRATRDSGATSYQLTAAPWYVGIGGASWGGNAALDFRATASIVIAGTTTDWITHAADGSLTIPIGANHGPLGVFGTADTGTQYFATDKLSRPPDGMASPAVSLIQPTSFRVSSVIPSSPTDPILEYQFRWALTPDFIPTAGSAVNNGYIYDVSGLTPGTGYYVQTRARNAAGWGPWSGIGWAQTLSGAYVSDGSTWKPCEVFISDGSAWATGLVQVSDGSNWKAAG